jgi:tetratricopeptide (TPR) repeat protein
VGLGNFEPIFAFSQVDSINGNRAIHPESDWLWLACEMGWLAPLIVLVGIAWWIDRCFPLESRPGESMRCAFIIAVLVFLLHGIFDVGGHRTGSLWVGLLVASLALPVDRDDLPSRATPLLFRGLGLAMLLIAAWWFSSLHALNVPPTTATLARLKNQAIAPEATPAQVEEAARAGLRIAPLDWNFYFHLGAVEASEPDKIQQAVADFNTARALDPYWIALIMQEGDVWMAANQPDLCLDTWRDGLRRAGPQAPEAFRQMVDAAPPHSVEREGLAELAFNRLDFLLMLLPTSPVSEAEALLSHLLENDPHLDHLTAAQRSQLFPAWWAQGDQVRMIEVLNAHPDWASETWLYQAQFAAKENDFQHACEIASHWAPAPMIPSATSDRSLDDLEQDFRSNPDTLTSGLILFFAQKKEGKMDDALATLEKLTSTPKHPAYLDYMAAQLYAGTQDWPSAWRAWTSYLNP